ncbi:hypothetical protein P175DRAFT_0532620 [Aspergillus ochraceoroseus IBT 24754]|uniref:Uncharacterized protein n=1 Tax=Aspergillus ochraceoroseus IBT 24754 TaxID=1392256 RepID=A0A2T5LY84_9EURO|nr:uncharacterized protein P175DRAFT_0532620 [Aspergillus ochraceoroseus IBT 24754]PTU21242.1 hypothetical protein P175DRAFT_0532620 [Aspergillus ochraceoroseus IBT 24754]
MADVKQISAALHREEGFPTRRVSEVARGVGIMHGGGVTYVSIRIGLYETIQDQACAWDIALSPLLAFTAATSGFIGAMFGTRQIWPIFGCKTTRFYPLRLAETTTESLRNRRVALWRCHDAIDGHFGGQLLTVTKYLTTTGGPRWAPSFVRLGQTIATLVLLEDGQENAIRRV